MPDTKIYNKDGTAIIAYISDEATLVLSHDGHSFTVVGHPAEFYFSNITLKDDQTEREKGIQKWIADYQVIAEYRNKVGDILNWIREAQFIFLYPCNIPTIDRYVTNGFTFLTSWRHAMSLNFSNSTEVWCNGDEINLYSLTGLVNKGSIMDFSLPYTVDGRRQIDDFLAYMAKYPAYRLSTLSQSFIQGIDHFIRTIPSKKAVDIKWMDAQTLVLSVAKSVFLKEMDVLRVYLYSDRVVKLEGDWFIATLIRESSVFDDLCTILQRFIKNPQKNYMYP